MKKTVDDFTIGDPATYVPNHAHGECSHPDSKKGFITSKNDKYVFVRFNGSTSAACLPENLVPG